MKNGDDPSRPDAPSIKRGMRTVRIINSTVRLPNSLTMGITAQAHTTVSEILLPGLNC